VRRWLLALGICAAIGCGIDVVGALDGPVAPGADGGVESGAKLPDLDASGDATASEASTPEGGLDAASLDAEATRPDAGVVFVPSHIYPDYTLTAKAVHISTDTVVDTGARTISVGGASPVPIAEMVPSGDVAVWSVGDLTIDSGVTLEVVGARPLVVVASGDVAVNGVFAVYGDRKRPGPGGAAPASGTGKGGNGAKAAGTDASGGGGAGHATNGGAGGAQGAVAGGTPGPIANADGALLVGGAGGGHGGGFPGTCTDPTRGKGGFGGGALQISAVGKITIAGTGVIDAGGGAGLGGCKSAGPDDIVTGGGGGGAGGIVVLESPSGIELKSGAEIAAGGGGGGEGGSTSDPGKDGESGISQPARAATGGGGSGGGSGGAGGYGVFGSASAPFGGFAGVSAAAGGGGGAVGQVFLGVRTASTRKVGGSIAALRSDFAF
jgi:hypothetical protein